MYCTGGIRCERATALLNQMSAVKEELKPKGVYHCRGGIERYVKTFPSGGFWKGKNYLFDKRMEQTPDVKPSDTVEKDISSRCCLCKSKWTVYRGQFKCSRSLCGVPVIVCNSCQNKAIQKPGALVCDLCKEGYRAPSQVPDLVAMKRKAEELVADRPVVSDEASQQHHRKKKLKVFYEDCLFLRRVPLTASFTKIKDAIGADVKRVIWLTDKETKAFYGSCVALMSTSCATKQLLEKGSSKTGIKIDNKRIKIAEMFQKDNETLFEGFVQKEYPPIGNGER